MSDQKLWNTVWARELADRGFDYDGGGVSHFCVSQPLPGFEFREPRDPAALLVEDEVRGTLMAIAEMAGFPALLSGLDPDVTPEVARALCVTREIEDAARTLRIALETHISEPRGSEPRS